MHCHGQLASTRLDSIGARPVPVGTYVAIADKAIATGHPEDAQGVYLTILEREPNNFDALFGMAMLAESANDNEASVHYHSRLATAHPRNARALFALGNFFAKRFDFVRARSSYRAALELAPTWANVWNNLGNVEKYLGNLKEGIACYDRAVAADPDNAALHSAALISLYYDDSLSNEELFERHVAWGDRHAACFYTQNRSWENSRDRDRKLRVGYVSEGFDGRILGHFLSGVLPHHDRGQFTTYAYSGVRRPDDFTINIRCAFDHWREVRTLTDDAVAAQVEHDNIDILVDLDGHTPDSRLLVFARKPAPIQIAWLGYWNTTGMRTVDYILTDPYTTPECSPQRFIELPLRLPDSRFCYTPVPYAPPVSPLPFTNCRVFTFGSFNRYDKLGPAVIECWSEILRRVPGSRMVIKNSAIAIPNARANLARQFTDRGIDASRIELRARSPHPVMLAEYADIDLGLDTFPYNGGLTTCEALWQGLPVLAIEEERMISRQTSAMLRLVGAAEFVARTREEYISLAVRWANDTERLGDVRRTLRDSMRASPLCDGPRFTRNLETALRVAWWHYCDSDSSD